MLKKYLIVVLGSLFYCYEFFLRVSPSAITDTLMAHFSVTATGFSIMSAAFFYAYMPMQMYAGVLGDKYGVRKVLGFCIALCSIATILFVISPNIWFATLARFLMGLSASFAYIGPLMLASAWLDEKYYAASAGLIQVLGSLGAYLVGSEVGANMLEASWQNTYYILSIVGLILMILVWVFVRNTPKDKTLDTSESDIDILNSLKEILCKSHTWFIALTGFAFWAPMSVFGELWGVSFLQKSEHVSMLVANSQIKYLWLGVAAGGPIWGYLSCFQRRLVTSLAYIISMLSLVLIIYVNSFSLTTVDLLLFIFGFACAAQCISFGYMRDFQGSHLIGTAVGFNNMFVILGGTILQPLSGFLIDYFIASQHASYVESMKLTFIMLPIISIFGLFVLNYCVEKRD